MRSAFLFQPLRLLALLASTSPSRAGKLPPSFASQNPPPSVREAKMGACKYAQKAPLYGELAIAVRRID